MTSHARPLNDIELSCAASEASKKLRKADARRDRNEQKKQDASGQEQRITELSHEVVHVRLDLQTAHSEIAALQQLVDRSIHSRDQASDAAAAEYRLVQLLQSTQRLNVAHQVDLEKHLRTSHARNTSQEQHIKQQQQQLKQNDVQAAKQIEALQRLLSLATKDIEKLSDASSGALHRQLHQSISRENELSKELKASQALVGSLQQSLADSLVPMTADERAKAAIIKEVPLGTLRRLVKQKWGRKKPGPKAAPAAATAQSASHWNKSKEGSGGKTCAFDPRVLQAVGQFRVDAGVAAVRVERAVNQACNMMGKTTLDQDVPSNTTVRRSMVELDEVYITETKREQCFHLFVWIVGPVLGNGTWIHQKFASHWSFAWTGWRFISRLSFEQYILILQTAVGTSEGVAELWLSVAVGAFSESLIMHK